MASYSKDIKQHTKRKIPAIVLLCTAVYFTSYLARLSFAAVTVEIILSEGLYKFRHLCGKCRRYLWSGIRFEALRLERHYGNPFNRCPFGRCFSPYLG
jgi:hypothetical protein